MVVERFFVLFGVVVEAAGLMGVVVVEEAGRITFSEWEHCV